MPVLCGKYTNVVYYHQANKGAGRARNSVIPLCTGKYTYFLDADDVINAKSLEHAVKKAILEDADLLLMKYKIEYYDEKKQEVCLMQMTDYGSHLKKKNIK